MRADKCHIASRLNFRLDCYWLQKKYLTIHCAAGYSNVDCDVARLAKMIILRYQNIINVELELALNCFIFNLMHFSASFCPRF